MGIKSLEVEDDVRFEIHHYAKRNRLVHSEVENLINDAEFDALAAQIVKDKENLSNLYGGDAQIQRQYRAAIARIEEEYFDECFRAQNGVFKCFLTEKAESKRRADVAKAKRAVVAP